MKTPGTASAIDFDVGTQEARRGFTPIEFIKNAFSAMIIPVAIAYMLSIAAVPMSLVLIAHQLIVLNTAVNGVCP